jgi:hypothetical protein
MMHVYKPISEWHRRYDLTPEKIYDCEWNGEMVYSSDGAYYKLINDIGHNIEVHSSHFIRLDDFRENKLNDLGV